MFRLFLILHVLGATIWVGGHIVLSLAVLPRALRARNPAVIQDFEHRFERVGLPALLVQVLTGLHLATRWVPDVTMWFAPANAIGWLVTLKLALLAATIVLALHARLGIIPRLTPERLPALAAHIIAVTVIGVCLVILGVGIRTGGLF